jgi:hypothetical protein
MHENLFYVSAFMRLKKFAAVAAHCELVSPLPRGDAEGL